MGVRRLNLLGKRNGVVRMYKSARIGATTGMLEVKFLLLRLCVNTSLYLVPGIPVSPQKAVTISP